MTKPIAISGLEGTLEVNDDGEVVYAKSGMETEVLTPDQAIKRWPEAEKQIKEALEELD